MATIAAPTCRRLGVVVLAFLWGVLVNGCGSASAPCGSATCSGCCDSAGVCQGGAQQKSCGVAGAVCVACSDTEQCLNGGCVGTGGGSGGGGGGGGVAGGITGGVRGGVAGGSGGGAIGGATGGAGGGSVGGVAGGASGGLLGGGGGSSGSSGGTAGGGGGGCGNTSSDPLNCGVCGHSCLGGACTSGRCQPVTLASLVGNPQELVLSETHVYVTERRRSLGSFLSRVTLDGGTFEGLTALAQLAGGAQLHDSSVYVAIGSTNQIAKVPQAGGGAVDMVTSQDGGSTSSLVIDRVGKRILFNNSPRATLSSIPLTGGPLVDFATVPVSAQGLSLSPGGDVLYLAAQDSSGAVGRVALDGSTAGTYTRLSVEVDPFDTAATDSHVYFTTSADGGIRRVSVDGGRPAETIVSGQAAPTAIALDESYVYWTNFLPPSSGGSANGSIMRAPLTGPFDGGAEMLADGLNGPADLQVDGTAIYWVNRWGRTVMKLAKPPR